MIVSWFSAGVSSAVATKLAIQSYGVDKIIYTHIDDQHPDTLRFVKDCEEWFGQPIEIMQSPLKSVKNACLQYGNGYIGGPRGAECTRALKKKVRHEWEKKQTEPLCYLWGLDPGEAHRCERLEAAMPLIEHRFPLIEHNIDKAHAHKILKASEIKRPAMYDLGYHNNNCVGCVKGGIGYWNKIRQDFPDIFWQRASMERKMGHTILKDKNGLIYLDELDPERGRHDGPIVEACGIMCETVALK